MDWREPYNAWDLAQRKRMDQSSFNTVVMLLIALMVPLVIWHTASNSPAIPRRTFLDDLLRPIALCSAAVFLVKACMTVRQWRVETQIHRLIPLHNGLVCPSCLEPLVVIENDPTCRCCDGRYTPQALRRFWEAYALNPTEAPAQLRRIMKDDPSGRGADLHRLNVGMVARALSLLAFGIIFSVPVLLLDRLAMAPFRGGSALATLLELFPLFLLLAGFTLMAWGWRGHRLDEGVYCTKCGYQYAPQGINPHRCPECGEAWLNAGGTVYRDRVRRPWTIVLGVLLVASIFGLSWGDYSWRGPLYSSLPTDSLIRAMTPPYGKNGNEQWAAIQQRSLTREQEIELAERLLAVRQSDRWMAGYGNCWFAAMIAARRLPAELVDRYYREEFDISLIAPTSVKIGESLAVGLKTYKHTYYWDLASLTDVTLVYFGGFFKDDSSEAVARCDRNVFTNDMGDSRHEPAAASFYIDKPGPCRIRAIVWLVAGPHKAMGADALWQSDGTPLIPAGATWSKRIELENTVEVVQ
ncbi:MAG TPA: hypothetical protein VMV94_20910 [Phycisphaerae bacterium]|nr:hypothetical protein [Phycisphaerae bacterium]